MNNNKALRLSSERISHPGFGVVIYSLVIIALLIIIWFVRLIISF